MKQTLTRAAAGDQSGPNVLMALRALLPSRQINLPEALTIVERQAAKLLALQHIDDVPVPTSVVTNLPRVTVLGDPKLTKHEASGTSHWDPAPHAWVISINPEEPPTRQRFTILHESWHIVMHFHPGLGGQLPHRVFGLEPIEYLADYFAGCVLMPKRLLQAAYYDGIQRVGDLAELFDVSVRAIEVRLAQLGLREAVPPASTDRRYRMQSPATVRETGRSVPRIKASHRDVRRTLQEAA